VQDLWQSLSLLYKLFFVVVGMGFLIILARQGFPWDTLNITALSQATWYIGAIGIGFVLIVLLFLLWKLPKRKVTRLKLELKGQFDVENETRKTWATIVGGMAVLFSLLFTWGNLRVTQDNLRITQEAATKSQELTRQGQITDRFTKAIAQLGEQEPEKLAIRLGGIYALERIARDSKRDHWPIMEILTAYVREHAPWPPKDIPLLADDLSPTEKSPEGKGQPQPKPAPDIQAILTVLGRRMHTYEQGEKDQWLNLQGTNLQGANLWGAYLEGADLEGAQLNKAKLWQAQLDRANLRGAHLEGARFWAASLKEANLSEAQLKGAEHLTVEQLCTVHTLYEAQLDPSRTEQIRQQCPQHLEKPQE
jgi:hypothetical protein